MTIEEDLEGLEALEARSKATLARLLDDSIAKEGHVIAIRSEMGVALGETGTSVRVPSYVSVHTLRWIGNKSNLKMGSEMPFMQRKISEKGVLTIDETNAYDVKQRAPDWSRQPALAQYLLRDAHRKFGTILAVVSPAWIDNPKHENWGPGGVALRSAIDFSPLDSSGKVGLLNVSTAAVYALDGQHRVMGIRGLIDLLDGPLYVKKGDGTPTKNSYTRETFLEMARADETVLSELMDESLSVEYIPAVIKGETREQATQRVRSIFVAVNSYAKKTDKGENILLDESDGFAITARHTALVHPLFKANSGGSRVNWKNTGLPARSHTLTTLLALKDMTKEFIIAVEPDLVRPWVPTFKDSVPMRPTESELDTAQTRMKEFFDQVGDLPSMKAMDNGEPLDPWREFPDEGRGHLLFRPVGQVVLAQAVGELVASGMTLDHIFARLSRLDSQGGFEQADPKNLWYGVTFDPVKQKMQLGNNKLAVRALVYLVRGADSEQRDLLLDDLRKARTDAGNQWINFAGKHVGQPDEDVGSHLPDPVMLP